MGDSTSNLTPQMAEKVALAQIAKLEAEALKATNEADQWASSAAMMRIELASQQRQQKVEDSRVYRFFGQVSGSSVALCMGKLNGWRLNDPGCDIEIVFNSPGGSVIDGLALFDFIQELRRDGHHITTSSLGYAASMGSILLQAGDHRVMGREAIVMIHEISFGAGGKIGEIEDSVEMGKILGKRLFDILAQRSTLSAKQIENRAERRDWWITSEEALKLGFVDEVR